MNLIKIADLLKNAPVLLKPLEQPLRSRLKCWSLEHSKKIKKIANSPNYFCKII